MMTRSHLLFRQEDETEVLMAFQAHLLERLPDIERRLAQLKSGSTDLVLFEAFASELKEIGRQAAANGFILGGLILQPIERLLLRVGATSLPCNKLLTETVFLALDRLELAVEALIDKRPLEQLKLELLIDELEQLALVSDVDFAATAMRMIESVTGFRPAQHDNQVLQSNAASAISHSSRQVAADLLFFRLLNKQYEVRSPIFSGRRQRLLRFALATNREAGTPIDPVQLEAAVYMHDVGMMFLPESLWLKVGQLSQAERLQMQAHPVLAAGLLERMPGWQAAAEMVAQHHEMPDGKGYPQRLHEAQICAGAKLLAILDAFEAVMLKHNDRGASRSMLRAIAEVNACNNQFAAEWVQPFNTVIRHMLEK